MLLAYLRHPRLIGLLGLATIGGLPSIADAGISLVSQERSIRAVATHGEPDPAFPDVVKSAGGFGLFDETVQNSITDALDQDRASSFASMSSDLTSGRLRAVGRIDVNEQSEAANGFVRLRVVFDVTDAAQPYSLSYSMSSTDPGTSFAPDTVVGTIDLRRIDPAGPSVAGPDSIVFNDIDPNDSGPGQLVNFAGGGSLPIGRYELLLDASSASTTQTHAQTEYAVDLKFADGDNGGPSAVPLPPAGWAGLITLGGMGLAHYRRRRIVQP